MAKKKSKKVDEIAGPSPAMDDEWKVRDAYDTLKRAEDVKNDPELMKKLKAHTRKEKKKMRSIEDLVNYRNTEYGMEDSED